MFWKKKQPKTGPTSVPGFVGAAVVAEMQKNPQMSDHWVKFKAVLRPRVEAGGTAFDFRIYDEWETENNKLKVTDYASLDSHPDLIQYEGWFDKATKKVQLKTKLPPDLPPR